MKKLVRMALMCCAAVVCALTMTGCGVSVEGDFLYDVSVSEGTSAGSYMSYKAYAESTILDAVKTTGAIQTDGNNTYFILSGNQKKCDKKMAAAVAKAMDDIEHSEDYDTTIFVVDEVTVEVSRNGEEGKVTVFSRKFKTQKNH